MSSVNAHLPHTHAHTSARTEQCVHPENAPHACRVTARMRDRRLQRERPGHFRLSRQRERNFHPWPRATAEMALLKHSISAASAARASSSTVRAACQLRARSHAESAVPNDVVSGLSPSALIATIKRSAAFQLRAAAAAASAAL